MIYLSLLAVLLLAIANDFRLAKPVERADLFLVALCLIPLIPLGG